MLIPTQRKDTRKNGHSDQTHCSNGHEFNEENTYISPKSQKRSCRICCSLRVKTRRKCEPGFRERSTENMRLWRSNNPERNNKNWTDLRKKKKIWLEKHKRELGCSKCIENDPSCLDFHHRDPTQKEMTISLGIARASLERLQKEVAKCDILCSNCHRKLHASERNL